MTQRNYSYRVQQFTMSGGFPPIHALVPNQLRRSIIISSFNGGAQFIYDHNPIIINDAFIINTNGSYVIMPYRDYGPLITGDVFVGIQGVAVIFSVTEIFLLP